MVDLDTCAECGGSLRLTGGTDPEFVTDIDGWMETYRCQHCDGTGMYGMNPKTQVEWSTGVVG